MGPWAKVPNQTGWTCVVLTWARDRTRGSRLNNFYKKGKGKKKKENIWELITHGRQIQNETANSHATDTTILFNNWAGGHRPVTNMRSPRVLRLGLHTSVPLFPATSLECHQHTTSGPSHAEYTNIFACPLGKATCGALKLQTISPAETCLEKGGFALVIEGSFTWGIWVKVTILNKECF